MYPQDTSAYFNNLIQQAGEVFTNFLAHVNDAVKHRVNAGPTGDMLIKQLT